jgi:hypothetical protein
MDPQMQRRETMRASVIDRLYGSLGVAEQQDFLFQENSIEQAARLDFVIPRCHVPSIFKRAHDSVRL